MKRIGIAAIGAAVLLAGPATSKAQGTEPGWEQYERGELAAATAIWTDRAAQGEADAALGLAVVYDDWRSAHYNPMEAVRWYTEAAEQGHAAAQFNLAVSHYRGEGTPVDVPEAMRWYRRAADQGFADAHYNLARILQTGDGGIPVDEEEARRLYYRIAWAGHLDAQAQLIALYEQTDPLRAAYWRIRWTRARAAQCPEARPKQHLAPKPVPRHSPVSTQGPLHTGTAPAMRNG